MMPWAVPSANGKHAENWTAFVSLRVGCCCLVAGRWPPVRRLLGRVIDYPRLLWMRYLQELLHLYGQNECGRGPRCLDDPAPSRQCRARTPGISSSSRPPSIPPGASPGPA
jgi:hypothetical protein